MLSLSLQADLLTTVGVNQGEVASSVNAFGLELLGQVTAGAPALHSNVLLCPLSVAAALNMVAAGATEDSPCAAQLDAALHLPASTHHIQLHDVLKTILQVGRFCDFWWGIRCLSPRHPVGSGATETGACLDVWL